MRVGLYVSLFADVSAFNAYYTLLCVGGALSVICKTFLLLHFLKKTSKIRIEQVEVEMKEKQPEVAENIEESNDKERENEVTYDEVPGLQEENEPNMTSFTGDNGMYSSISEKKRREIVSFLSFDSDFSCGEGMEDHYTLPPPPDVLEDDAVNDISLYAKVDRQRKSIKIKPGVDD
uniref:uncharacterized protein LOC100181844 isoform X3 n=1 Tax=Ciona intestinalis TaxID=7719 RepID=UPI00089DAD5F|nr:uncharacterized protein LOC100181844 isoform X3 [Ciona intestinalis]|eukprot:XP_018672550.1 uncharacterized protein LOC100181844 isoform X3 [Ciona intestinalis]